ncbi:cytochrome P450 [Zopfia rhizophila CBS 207.26]|uniref:Cytochrome P450 n=1 Tax=Zopfia rhizophila CBS 207.26 TaxID=1314779 RepID=A0A6A6E7W4_9PEZI|nr:cytochrome P450 [Zopfia rhizophila CBS 207.26]
MAILPIAGTYVFVFNLPVQTSVALSLFSRLLIWRLWNFRIVPFLHPERPKTLPYWIPWLGNSLWFFRNADATLTKARLYFGNKREPFALVLGDQYVYIITSAKDSSVVYKSIETLGFNKYVTDIMIRFGASPEGVVHAWNTPTSRPVKTTDDILGVPGKPISHYCEKIIRTQLHPGAEMQKLRSAFLGRIHQRVTWNAIPQSVILHGHEYALLKGMTTSCYGSALMEIEPRFLEAFTRFDDAGWKLMYKIPSNLSKDMLSAKEIMQNAFDQYFDLPTLDEEMRKAGTRVGDITTFWLVAHTITNPQLKTAIEAEILPLLTHSPPLPLNTLQKHLETLPILTAAYNETLRTTVSSITARDVIAPVSIANKQLSLGARVIIPYRQMLLDTNAFGADAETFNPDRFLRNPSLVKNSSFRPEVLTLTALLVGRFEMEAVVGRFPRMDTAKPCLGVMSPMLGDDVVVRVTPRAV